MFCVTLAAVFDGRVSRWAVPAIAGVLLLGCSDSPGSSGEPATTTTSTSTSTSTTSSTTASTTTTSTVAPVDAHTLQTLIDDFAAEQPVPFSIVLADLTTGTRVEHDAGRQVLSASLYKLFVAQELLRRIHAGDLSRDAPAGDGQGRTVNQCIIDMIVVSDDPCGVAGLGIVGRGVLDDDLAAEGYVSTRLASPQRTSAADVALFFERARLGEEPALAELYGLLEQQAVTDRFPMGLPPGTPIAHKTGDRTNWAHDSGVITTPRGDVLLVVLTGPWAAPCCHAETPGPAEATAFGAIAELAAAVYNAF